MIKDADLIFISLQSGMTFLRIVIPLLPLVGA